LRTLIQALDVDGRCGPDAWLRQATDPTLPQLLARFGHRAAGEWELAHPRWREQPATLQQLLRTHRLDSRDAPRPALEKARRRRERAERRLPQMLSACGASSVVEQVQRDLATVRNLLPYREIGKHYLMMGYDLIRQAVEALADRLDLGPDIYFLTMQELRQYVAGERLATQGQATTLVGQRRFQWQVLSRVALPDVVDGQTIDGILNDVPSAAGDEWIEATSLSNGVARGPVRLVAEQTAVVDPARTGYVLVCEALDPSLTPLLAGACALVVRRGGMLSHGAAVARQMGLPAVACPRLPVSINDANWLVVDGSRGRVRMERGT
jgi:pyruvate,water dikinase